MKVCAVISVSNEGSSILMSDFFMSRQYLLVVPLNQCKIWNNSINETGKYAKPGDFGEFCEAKITFTSLLYYC